jgi:hypothetical protein
MAGIKGRSGRIAGKPHLAYVREKIRVTRVVNRLQDFINGKLEMNSSQVHAAEILLRKVLPDLSVIDSNLSVEQVNNVVYLPAPMSDSQEWQAMHAPARALRGGAVYPDEETDELSAQTKRDLPN